MKTLYLLLLVLVLSASSAFAQIARDAVAASTGTAVGFTLTVAHDCGSGSNRFLVVALQSSTDDITGVTFNGIAMTLADKSTGGIAQTWVLHAPATGSHDMVATNTGFHIMSAVIKCYTGAQQSSTVDSVSGSTDVEAFGTSLTMATTTVGDNAWTLYSVMCANTASSCAAGTGSSLVGQVLDGTYGSISLFDSNAVITPAGSYSMQATHGSNTAIYGSLVSIAPAGGGGGARPVIIGGGVF